MSNISYKYKEEENLTKFYKGNVLLGNPSSGINHPEDFVKVLEICSALSKYEVCILRDLIFESSLLGVK